jgi:hypothetical protein
MKYKLDKSWKKKKKRNLEEEEEEEKFGRRKLFYSTKILHTYTWV